MSDPERPIEERQVISAVERVRAQQVREQKLQDVLHVGWGDKAPEVRDVTLPKTEYRSKLPEVKGLLDDPMEPVGENILSAEREAALPFEDRILELQSRELRGIKYTEGRWVSEIARTSDRPKAIRREARACAAGAESDSLRPGFRDMGALAGQLFDRAKIFRDAAQPHLWPELAPELETLGLIEKRVRVPRLRQVSPVMRVYEITVSAEERAILDSAAAAAEVRGVVPSAEEGRESYKVRLKPKHLDDLGYDEEAEKILTGTREVVTPPRLSIEEMKELARVCEEEAMLLIAREHLGYRAFLFGQAAGSLSEIGKLFVDTNSNRVPVTEWVVLLNAGESVALAPEETEVRSEAEIKELREQREFGSKIDNGMRFLNLLGLAGGDYMGVRLSEYTVEEVAMLRLPVATEEQFRDYARYQAQSKRLSAGAVFEDIKGSLEAGQAVIKGKTIDEIENLKELLKWKTDAASREQLKNLTAILKFHEYFYRVATIKKEFEAQTLLCDLVGYGRMSGDQKRAFLNELAELASLNIFCSTPSAEKLQKVRSWVVEKIGGDKDDSSAAFQWAVQMFHMWGLSATYDSRLNWRRDPITGQLRPAPAGSPASSDLMKLFHFKDYRTREAAAGIKPGEMRHNHGPVATQGSYLNSLAVDVLRKMIVERGDTMGDCKTAYEKWWNDRQRLGKLPWKAQRNTEDAYNAYLQYFFGGFIKYEGKVPVNMIEALLNKGWRRDELINGEVLRELNRTVDYVSGGHWMHGGEIQKWLRNHPEARNMTEDQFMHQYIGPKQQTFKEELLFGALTSAYMGKDYLTAANEWALWSRDLGIPWEQGAQIKNITRRELDLWRIIARSRFLDSQAIERVSRRSGEYLKANEVISSEKDRESVGSAIKDKKKRYLFGR